MNADANRALLLGIARKLLLTVRDVLADLRDHHRQGAEALAHFEIENVGRPAAEPIASNALNNANYGICALPIPTGMSGCGFEMMRVFQDSEDRLFVQLADVMDMPSSWGSFLSDVGLTIARDLVGPTASNEAYAELRSDNFAELCNGFNRVVEE